MAGLGSRFAKEGYTLPKPLLPIDGIPMVVHAANSLPFGLETRLIALEEHLKAYPIEREVQKFLDKVKILSIPKLTEGQAITVSFALKDLDPHCPIFIAACDNDMLYELEKLNSLTQDKSVDGIVFTFRGNPTSKNHPEMYGWVKQVNNIVESVSVKAPISSNPIQDPAIVGAFYFRSVQMYEEILQELIKRNLRVNGEFYIDSMVGLGVEMGYKFLSFPIDYYICWGTPNDYKTFHYWQEFFDKVSWHPYKKP